MFALIPALPTSVISYYEIFFHTSLCRRILYCTCVFLISCSEIICLSRIPHTWSQALKYDPPSLSPHRLCHNLANSKISHSRHKLKKDIWWHIRWHDLKSCSHFCVMSVELLKLSSFSEKDRSQWNLILIQWCLYSAPLLTHTFAGIMFHWKPNTQTLLVSQNHVSCFTVLESLAQRWNVDGAALLPFGCKIEEVLTTKATNNHTFKASTDYQIYFKLKTGFKYFKTELTSSQYI